MYKHSAQGILITTATVLSLAVTGCTSGNGGDSDDDNRATKPYELSATTPEPAGEIDHFTWALGSEPYSLNPAYAFDWADNTVLSNVCESLFRWNSDFTMSPGLAESYEHPDPLTWIYKIREGVKFHDGTDLTARDVVASLEAQRDPSIAGFWASVFDNVESIEQTTDYEVTVKTTVPDLTLHQHMAAAPGAISSADSLEAAGRDYGNQSTGVNCTGPFKFESWKPGESIEFSRFDDYWDPELKAKSKSVTFAIMTDPNTRVSALQTGEVDGNWTVPLPAVDSLRNADNGKLYFGSSTVVQSLVVSDMEGPLADKRVRQALSMAINRDALVEAAARGYATPTGALTPKSAWVGASPETVERAFPEFPTAEYDLEAARKLIDEAGAKGAEVTLASTALNPALPVIAQAVASAGAEIGLKVNIDDRPANAYTLLFSDPSALEGVDMFITSWYCSTGDPMGMYQELQTGKFSNYGKWSNPEFDKLAKEALQTIELEPRMKLAADLQLLVSDELPWIPLYAPPMIVWMGDRITGADPASNFLYYPWAAKIGSAE